MTKIEVLQDEVRATARNKDKHEIAFHAEPTRENMVRAYRAFTAYDDAVTALRVHKNINPCDRNR